MKKYFAISLLFMYLISGTEAFQLFKIPMLVHHFQEHKAQKSEITFWEFICMHYAHGNVVDADHDQDQKLPFKSHDGCSNLNELASLPYEHVLNTKPHVISTPLNIHHEEDFLSSTFLSCIWQPPKSC